MVAIIIVAPVITAKANNYQDEVLSSSSYKQAQFVEPEGDENVHTVAVGRPIKFKCVVNNLGDRKVSDECFIRLVGVTLSFVSY